MKVYPSCSAAYETIDGDRFSAEENAVLHAYSKMKEEAFRLGIRCVTPAAKVEMETFLNNIFAAAEIHWRDIVSDEDREEYAGKIRSAFRDSFYQGMLAAKARRAAIFCLQ